MSREVCSEGKSGQQGMVEEDRGNMAILEKGLSWGRNIPANAIGF